MMNAIPGLTDWVLTRKRITNKQLRDRFDLTEEEADDVYYHFLRPLGIMTTMGHVNHEWNDDDLLCVEESYNAWRAFKPSRPMDTVAYFDTLDDAIHDIRARGIRVMYEANNLVVKDLTIGN